MLYIDVTTNSNYTDKTLNVSVIGIKALHVYSYDLEFKTLVDSSWSGTEQRRDQWSRPRRTWTLDFKKTPELGKKLEQFFIDCMGKKKAFMFKWNTTNDEGNNLGGDGNWYKVRFDTDKLSTKVNELGYREVTNLKLIEVLN